MVYFDFRSDSQVCIEVNGLERFDFVSFEESFAGNQSLHLLFCPSENHLIKIEGCELRNGRYMDK